MTAEKIAARLADVINLVSAALSSTDNVDLADLRGLLLAVEMDLAALAGGRHPGFDAHKARELVVQILRETAGRSWSTVRPDTFQSMREFVSCFANASGTQG